MSVSFIINPTDAPKTGKKLSIEELDLLLKLMSSPISVIAQSDVMVIDDKSRQIKVADLSVANIALLKISIGNFRVGMVNKINLRFSNEEMQLVIAMAKNDLNVSRAAKYLNITRDKIRGDLKHFLTKWSIDLTTYVGLCRAYSLATSC